MVRAGLAPIGAVASRTTLISKRRRLSSELGRQNSHDGRCPTLTTEDLPGAVDLAWASFPCQDLSLDGGAPVEGRSIRHILAVLDLMKALIAEGRPPRIIALENVCGTLTSHEGKDFAAICSNFEKAGYVFGAVVIDAVVFVPRSRPRLFLIIVHGDVEIPAALMQGAASPLSHPGDCGRRSIAHP